MKPSQTVLSLSLFVLLFITTSMVKSPRHHPPEDAHYHDSNVFVNEKGEPISPYTGKLVLLDEKHEVKEIVPFINTNNLWVTAEEVFKPGGENHSHFKYKIVYLEKYDKNGKPISGQSLKVAVDLKRVDPKELMTSHSH